jgi:hypothetical protein
MPRAPPAVEGRDVNGMSVFEQETSVYLGVCLSGPTSCVRVREIAMGGLTYGGGREADGNKGLRGTPARCSLGPPILAVRSVGDSTCVAIHTRFRFHLLGLAYRIHHLSMRARHTAHSTPTFPVYTAVFLSPEELVLGGGGGASKTGIKNKLVRHPT